MKNIVIEWEEAMKLRDRFERDSIISENIYGLSFDIWEKIRADENAHILFIFPANILGRQRLMCHISANGLSWFIPFICISKKAINDFDK